MKTAVFHSLCHMNPMSLTISYTSSYCCSN